LLQVNGPDTDIFSTMAWRNNNTLPSAEKKGAEKQQEEKQEESAADRTKTAQLIKKYTKQIQDMSDKHAEELKAMKTSQQEVVKNLKQEASDLDTQIRNLQDEK
jgi:gas vesicle protein